MRLTWMIPLAVVAASACAHSPQRADVALVHPAPVGQGGGFRFDRIAFDDPLVLMGDKDVDSACYVPNVGAQRIMEVFTRSETYEPPKISGVKIRVRHTPKPLKALGRKMGTSTSDQLHCSLGTLGFTAFDNADPTQTGYVTCDHVARTLACYDGTGGDQSAPATLEDQNCLPQTIGTWLRSAPVDPRVDTNEVDAAFVCSRLSDAENDCGLCTTSTTTAKPPEVLQTMVRKCGRETGFTCGKVTGIRCAVRIHVDGCNQKVVFQNQIRVEQPGFSVDGDSGSAVYTEDGRLVGLLFAGDSDELTFINPIDTVLRQLNVSILIPNACPPQPACPSN